MDASEISRHLTSRDQMFDFRKMFTCVPNVSYGLLDWEADLVVCNKSGYISEVEIKISASDWKADKHKRKWMISEYSGKRSSSWCLIRHFYYAAPLGLAKRWDEFGIPAYAGVIGVTKTLGFPKVSYRSEIIKPAKQVSDHRKLTQLEMMKLARLGSIRIWTHSCRRDNA